MKYLKHFSPTQNNWIHKIIKPDQIISSLDKLMKLLIRVDFMGLKNGLGGPFVAAVVSEKGHVISVAHNKVSRSTDSTAHAEIMAIRLAQKKLKTTDLNQWKSTELLHVTTIKSCVMCSGAITWAGLPRVVAAARHRDAIKGGIKPDLMHDASRLFLKRKIAYTADFMRKAAAKVFIQ